MIRPMIVNSLPEALLPCLSQASLFQAFMESIWADEEGLAMSDPRPFRHLADLYADPYWFEDCLVQLFAQFPGATIVALQESANPADRRWLGVFPDGSQAIFGHHCIESAHCA